MQLVVERVRSEVGVVLWSRWPLVLSCLGLDRALVLGVGRRSRLHAVETLVLSVRSRFLQKRVLLRLLEVLRVLLIGVERRGSRTAVSCEFDRRSGIKERRRDTIHLCVQHFSVGAQGLLTILVVVT